MFSISKILWPWIYEVNCSVNGGNVGGYKRISRHTGRIEICRTYDNEKWEPEHYWEFYGYAANEDEKQKIIECFNNKKKNAHDAHLEYWRTKKEANKKWAEKQIYKIEEGVLKVASLD